MKNLFLTAAYFVQRNFSSSVSAAIAYLRKNLAKTNVLFIFIRKLISSSRRKLSFQPSKLLNDGSLVLTFRNRFILLVVGCVRRVSTTPYKTQVSDFSETFTVCSANEAKNSGIKIFLRSFV